MPWRTTNYHHYYYLDREKMLIPRIAMLLFVALGVFLTFHYLKDPTFYPKMPRVRGKGAIYVLILFLLISLPVWLRVPLSLLGLGEIFVYNVALLVWTFDKRPDFAIGPDGVYGIDYLTYRHISWAMIDHLEITTYQTKYSIKTSRRVRFIAKKWDERKPNQMADIKAKKLVLYPYLGTSHDEIVTHAKSYRPSINIIERSHST